MNPKVRVAILIAAIGCLLLDALRQRKVGLPCGRLLLDLGLALWLLPAVVDAWNAA